MTPASSSPRDPSDSAGVDHVLHIRNTSPEFALPEEERPHRRHRHSHSAAHSPTYVQPNQIIPPPLHPSSRSHRHTQSHQHGSATPPQLFVPPQPPVHPSRSSTYLDHSKYIPITQNASVDTLPPYEYDEHVAGQSEAHGYPVEKTGAHHALDAKNGRTEQTPPTSLVPSDALTSSPTEAGFSSDGQDVPHTPADSVQTLPADASSPLMVGTSQQHVPQELLSGVSMGFGVPSITGSRQPMPEPLPNVISLPYEHSPFHIRGLNWRSLLKLMARLSNTRIEPSVDAIAKVKTGMRLRVVVSFVKVHHSSPSWNTVLYMTIDRPVPNGPSASKFRNGDTCVLPYSYLLSAPPAVLRDGADAAMSKFYTIPSTPGNLYPLLPITFPDLAMYLASALDVSRNGVNDGQNYHGLNRLAKAVDTLYPEERRRISDDDRVGMRQKLKNLVGFGSKSSRDVNAETYDLVTPFVPDDFGR